MKTETEPLAVGSAKAAKLLDVSARTLHDLTYPRGPIRTVRLNREHRYPIDELKRYLREGLSGQDAQ